MKLNLGTVELVKAGESKGGKEILKTTLTMDNGDVCYISYYSGKASEPKKISIADELERQRALNKKLKKEAKTFDTTKREVATSDGGSRKVTLEERIAMAVAAAMKSAQTA